MSSHRLLSWSAALRDLKADRAARKPVREERLRTTGYVSGPLILSAWRGLSGRRYVVVIEPITATDLGDAVVIAVARDAAGTATLVGAGIAPGFTAPAGATELHVHRLAETPTDRSTVLADLGADILAQAAALLSRPEAWTQGASARDAAGHRVDPIDPRAVAWDLGGALDRVAAGNTTLADAADAAVMSLAQPGLPGIGALNDALTHAEVLALLRDAQHA